MPDAATPRLTTRRLLARDGFRIDHVVATATSNHPTALRAFSSHLLVLPYAGVFATHFVRRDAPVTGANQALLVPAGLEHRYSYPGPRGDRCLALSWHDGADPGTTPINWLLTPGEILERERLRALLCRDDADVLAIDECVARLRVSLLRAAHDGERRLRTGKRVGARCRRALERVQSAIATEPARAWTLDDLAAVAALSPHHLARVFASRVGTSLYEYVVRTRLGVALDAILHTDSDLASVAADAGFASHSHFTARFRARFGITPQAVRRSTRGPGARHRIVTAGLPRAI